MTTVSFSTRLRASMSSGIRVRERLEERERDHQLADAADVLLVVAAMLGIARLRGIGEVQHGEAVGVHAAA